MSQAFNSMKTKSKNLSSLVETKALLSIKVCRGLNDDVISLCIYSDVLLQPRDLPLGSHFIIIIGVIVIIIYFYIHVCQ